MTKPPSPFTGIKLTEQPSPAGAGIDQRLFSAPSSQPPPKAKQTIESQEVGKEGTREVGKEASQQVEREERQALDIDAKPYRKDSFLFTDEEFEALEDLKLELRRQFDLKVTKNDIARCALHHLIEDYQRYGESSIVTRRLRTKKLR